MKFLKKIKPSRVVRKREDEGFSPRAIEGAMVRMETVPTRKPGGRPNEKEPRDHLVLYATNSFCFVRIDLGLKDSLDEPGPIPAVALKHMESGVNADLGLDQIRVGITHYDRVLAPTRNGVKPPDPENFPDWEKVLTKAGALKSDPSGANFLSLNLNPRLLLDVAEAIGEKDQVQIILDLRQTKEYPGKKRRWYHGPLRVVGWFEAERDADAYLMPMKPEGHGDVDKSGGAWPH